MKPVFLSVLFSLLLFFLFSSWATAQQLWEKEYDLGLSAQAFSAVETDDHAFLVLGRVSTNDTIQALSMSTSPRMPAILLALNYLMRMGGM